MIAYVRGVLDHKEPNLAIIDVNGMGYEVFIPLSTYQELPAVGDQLKLHTYHHIREDTAELYGFLSGEEKDLFELVLSISGIGAKVALSILSTLSVDEFRTSVAQGNTKALTKIPGIGKKSAERIVLELKDKIGKIHIDDEMAKMIAPESGNDAVLALMGLDVSQSAAEYAVYRAERRLGEDANLEDVITEAIRLLKS
ncbi:Holliday junction branch migration protein RuvA [Candidatus Poribacteria bacterium]|nr:Holliday junction branch migration protein RuvA [Candidatus Poribacteria bacterium]